MGPALWIAGTEKLGLSVFNRRRTALVYGAGLEIHASLRYPPQILEEIRARLPASAVVGKRVRLKKAGREWKGLSPFNAEKTPSFYVNDQKQFYHCFSSGKHGDIFTFLMETEGLSFPEAVERLAGEAGVRPAEALPRGPAGGGQAQEPPRRHGAGGRVLRGLAAGPLRAPRRGTISPGAALSRETQARFRIGYAPPERYALRDHLAGKGVPVEMMVEAGLARRRRGREGPLRPLPRPGHVPDLRRARPGHRLRRPGHERRRAGQVPQLARTRRSSTRAGCSTTITSPASPPMTGAR